MATKLTDDMIQAARRDGLLVAADRFSVSPVELFGACIESDAQLWQRIKAIRAGLKPVAVPEIEDRLQETPSSGPRVRAKPKVESKAKAKAKVEPKAKVEVEDEPETPPLQPLQRVHGRGKGGGKGILPYLSRNEAEAAVHRARRIGIGPAAAELGVSYSTLTKTWTRLSIPGTGPRYAHEHPVGWKLTRDQAEAALVRARLVGRDLVAKELGVASNTLSRTWQRHGLGGISPQEGAKIRENRRRARAGS
jgi:hypothetical protein